MNRHDRSLRSRCVAMLEELNIRGGDGTVSFTTVCAAVRERRARELWLIPRTLTPYQACGAVIVSGQRDYIFFEAAASPAHRVHIVLHEIGHLLFGHSGVAHLDGQPGGPSRPDSAMVGQLLARTSFDDAEEREAEVFAIVAGVRIAPAFDDLQTVHRAQTVQADDADALAGLRARIQAAFVQAEPSYRG